MPRGHPDWGQESARLRFSQTVGAKLFEQKITVPKATVEGSPVSQIMTLVKGECSWLQIRFPKGPAGYLHVAIFDADGTTQLFPGAASTWFMGDDETIEFDTEFVVNVVASVYKIVIKGYNDDDTFEHSALVRAWVIAFP